MNVNLETFVHEYLRSALWADLPEENSDMGMEDLAQETIDRAKKDCEEFIAKNRRNITRAIEQMSLGHVAHDFWLTRNHHGAGYWDGDYTDIVGQRLTDSAHAFGNIDLYVGDDGLIYFFG